jgi:hypothetical protein
MLTYQASKNAGPQSRWCDHINHVVHARSSSFSRSIDETVLPDYEELCDHLMFPEGSSKLPNRQIDP